MIVYAENLKELLYISNEKVEFEIKNQNTVYIRSLNHVWLLVTLWTVACQAPLSMGLSWQESGVGCCFLLQGIFLIQG